MELTRTFAAVVLGTALFTACGKDQWDDCFTSTGPQRMEERTVGAFHTVDLSDRVDLLLEHRDAGTVAVSGGRNLLGQVLTEVRNGVLFVEDRNTCNWVRSFRPRLTVHVPIDAVATLTLRGTGNVSSTDTVRLPVLVIDQWNAQGTVRLPVVVDEVYTGLHSGAGDAVLTGRARRSHLYSGVQGTIDALALRADTVVVNNSGVGDMRCRATHLLDASLYNAGDVYYAGHPATVHARISGSGRLIEVD